MNIKVKAAPRKGHLEGRWRIYCPPDRVRQGLSATDCPSAPAKDLLLFLNRTKLSNFFFQFHSCRSNTPVGKENRF